MCVRRKKGRGIPNSTELCEVRGEPEGGNSTINHILLPRIVSSLAWLCLAAEKGGRVRAIIGFFFVV